MGRAIEVANQIDSMNLRLEKLENIVRGMAHTLDELEKTVSKPKGKKDGKEKSNNERNDERSGKSNKRKANSVSKANKS